MLSLQYALNFAFGFVFLDLFVLFPPQMKCQRLKFIRPFLSSTEC